MPLASRTFRVALLVVLCAGLGVRLAWALSRPNDDAAIRQLPDQAEYLTLARSLLNGSGLQFYDDRFRQTVLAYRMPGYPAFLAACGGSPIVARGVQAVLDTSTALAAAILAIMLLPARSARRGAVLAAAVVAVNPFLVFFSGLLLSETLFAAMLTWGMVLLLAGARGGRFGSERDPSSELDLVTESAVTAGPPLSRGDEPARKEATASELDDPTTVRMDSGGTDRSANDHEAPDSFDSRGRKPARGPSLTLRARNDAPATFRPRLGTLLWLSGGLMIAASAMVRPSAPPLTVLLGVAAAFAARPADRSLAPFRPRWPLPVAATMGLLTLLVLAPWAFRNSRVLEVRGESSAWVWTTTNGGVTAYDGFNPDATGASDQSVLKSLPQLKSMNEVERSDYLGARAAEFVRQNPRRALELAALKAGRTWSPVPLSDEYGSRLYVWVGLLYSLPLDVLVVCGLTMGKMRRSGKLFLLAPAVYFTLVHMASVGSLRYRVPVEPPLAVLAAVGVATLRMPTMSWRRAGNAVSEYRGVGVSE